MNAKTLLFTISLGVAAAVSAPAAASAATEVQQAQSQNWAGYVSGASGTKSFRSVSGSWVEPRVTCTDSAGPTYSATWVGLGGAGGSGSAASGSGSGSGYGYGYGLAGPSASEATSLEQAGTEADCTAAGGASYFAWYEMVPEAPVKLPLTVNPGDHMSSRVTVTSDRATVTVTNLRTGRSATKTVPVSSPDTSTAEWITEAPSQCDQGGDCTPLSLADFGKVTFTSATATDAAGHTGSITDPEWSAAAVTLSPGASGYGMGQVSYQSAGGGSAGATPSSPSGDGSSFSISWSGAEQSSGSGGYAYPSGGYGYPGGGYGDGYPGYGYQGYGYPGGGWIQIYSY